MARVILNKELNEEQKATIEKFYGDENAAGNVSVPQGGGVSSTQARPTPSNKRYAPTSTEQYERDLANMEDTAKQLRDRGIINSAQATVFLRQVQAEQSRVQAYKQQVQAENRKAASARQGIPFVVRPGQEEAYLNRGPQSQMRNQGPTPLVAGLGQAIILTDRKTRVSKAGEEGTSYIITTPMAKAELRQNAVITTLSYMPAFQLDTQKTTYRSVQNLGGESFVFPKQEVIARSYSGRTFGYTMLEVPESLQRQRLIYKELQAIDKSGLPGRIQFSGGVGTYILTESKEAAGQFGLGAISGVIYQGGKAVVKRVAPKLASGPLGAAYTIGEVVVFGGMIAYSAATNMKGSSGMATFGYNISPDIASAVGFGAGAAAVSSVEYGIIKRQITPKGTLEIRGTRYSGVERVLIKDSNLAKIDTPEFKGVVKSTSSSAIVIERPINEISIFKRTGKGYRETIIQKGDLTYSYATHTLGKTELNIQTITESTGKARIRVFKNGRFVFEKSAFNLPDMKITEAVKVADTGLTRFKGENVLLEGRAKIYRAESVQLDISSKYDKSLVSYSTKAETRIAKIKTGASISDYKLEVDLDTGTKSARLIKYSDIDTRLKFVRGKTAPKIDSFIDKGDYFQISKSALYISKQKLTSKTEYFGLYEPKRPDIKMFSNKRGSLTGAIGDVKVETTTKVGTAALSAQIPKTEAFSLKLAGEILSAEISLSTTIPKMTTAQKVKVTTQMADVVVSSQKVYPATTNIPVMIKVAAPKLDTSSKVSSISLSDLAFPGIGSGASTSSSEMLPVPKPSSPAFDLGGFGLGGIFPKESRALFGGSSVTRKARYNPSILGLSFGKKQKNKGGLFSGFGIRGV